MYSPSDKRVAVALVVVLGTLASCYAYEVPNPTIDVFKNGGFRVSIPDSEGVQQFAFHGSVNKNLPDVVAGEINVDVNSKANGKWTYFNQDRPLKVGDVLHYWLWVKVNGLGYQRLNQTFKVKKLL